MAKKPNTNRREEIRDIGRNVEATWPARVLVLAAKAAETTGEVPSPELPIVGGPDGVEAEAFIEGHFRTGVIKPVFARDHTRRRKSPFLSVEFGGLKPRRVLSLRHGVGQTRSRNPFQYRDLKLVYGDKRVEPEFLLPSKDGTVIHADFEPGKLDEAILRPEDLYKARPAELADHPIAEDARSEVLAEAVIELARAGSVITDDDRTQSQGPLPGVRVREFGPQEKYFSNTEKSPPEPVIETEAVKPSLDRGVGNRWTGKKLGES